MKTKEEKMAPKYVNLSCSCGGGGGGGRKRRKKTFEINKAN